MTCKITKLQEEAEEDSTWLPMRRDQVPIGWIVLGVVLLTVPWLIGVAWIGETLVKFVRWFW